MMKKYVVVYKNDSREYESAIVDAENFQQAHDAAFDLSDDRPVVTLLLPDLPDPPMSFDEWYLQPGVPRRLGGLTTPLKGERNDYSRR